MDEKSFTCILQRHFFGKIDLQQFLLFVSQRSQYFVAVLGTNFFWCICQQEFIIQIIITHQIILFRCTPQCNLCAFKRLCTSLYCCGISNTNLQYVPIILRKISQCPLFLFQQIFFYDQNIFIRVIVSVKSRLHLGKRLCNSRLDHKQVVRIVSGIQLHHHTAGRFFRQTVFL